MPTLSITVFGDVQGVFYRQSTRETATRLGLTGYVENKAGGEVLIIATGTREQLDKLIAWCKEGPPRARVSQVQVDELSARDFTAFTIRR